jgi:hypothetical protein
MKISEKIKCAQFPCGDVEKNNYMMPSADIDTGKIRILMVTEAPPAERADYFYAPAIRLTCRQFSRSSKTPGTMLLICRIY